MAQSADSLLIGVRGTEALFQLLGSTTDPKKSIAEFQEKNGLREASAKPLLELLDLHNIQRRQVYGGLLDRLRKVLLERVRTLREEELLRLLERIFPYIALPSLREVVMTVLATVPALPLAYLRALRAAPPAVLASCPVTVKRQVWRMDRALFAEYTDALLAKHLPRCAGGHLREHTLPANRRAGSEALTELAAAIGDDQELITDLLNRLRARFVATGNRALCAARSDVLMALHGAGVTGGSIGNDAAFRATWVLDACARTDSLSDLQAGEVSAAVAQARGLVLADMAMAAADPAVTHTLARAALARLRAVVAREALPAADPLLGTVLELLELAGAARQLVRQALAAPRTGAAAARTRAASGKGGGGGAAAAGAAPPVPVDVLRVLCPCLAHVLIDPGTPVFTAHAVQLLSEQAAPRRGAAPSPPSAAGRLLTQLLAVDRAAAGDAPGVAQLAGALLHARPHAFQDAFVGALAEAVLGPIEGGVGLSAEMETAVLSSFLVPAAALAPAAHRALLRLLRELLLRGALAPDRVLQYALAAAEMASRPGAGPAVAAVALTELDDALIQALAAAGCAAEALAALRARQQAAAVVAAAAGRTAPTEVGAAGADESAAALAEAEAEAEADRGAASETSERGGSEAEAERSDAASESDGRATAPTGVRLRIRPPAAPPLPRLRIRMPRAAGAADAATASAGSEAEMETAAGAAASTASESEYAPGVGAVAEGSPADRAMALGSDAGAAQGGTEAPDAMDVTPTS